MLYYSAYALSATTHHDLGKMLEILGRTLQAGDHVLVMSNGGFGGVHAKLLEHLARVPINTDASRP